MPAEFHAAILWDKRTKTTKKMIFMTLVTQRQRYLIVTSFLLKVIVHLITQKVTAYDKLYKCRVEGSVKATVSVLEEIQV